MPVPVPTPTTRWRCALCGNLTRFDVQRSTRSREFVHVSLAGEAVVEERQVVAETVDHVTCRWCGRADAVELVPRPGEAGVPDPAAVADVAAAGVAAADVAAPDVAAVDVAASGAAAAGVAAADVAAVDPAASGGAASGAVRASDAVAAAGVLGSAAGGSGAGVAAAAGEPAERPAGS